MLTYFSSYRCLVFPNGHSPVSASTEVRSRALAQSDTAGGSCAQTEADLGPFSLSLGFSCFSHTVLPSSSTTGRSRCFAYWQDFQKCYANADSPSECAPQKDDYLECLHHTKEVARAKQVRDHYLAQAAKEAKEHRSQSEIRFSGGMMRVGIIGSEQQQHGGGDDEGKPRGGAEQKEKPAGKKQESSEGKESKRG